MSIEILGPQLLDRDLSRAHWQRTVGSVVMHELTDMYLGQAETDVAFMDRVSQRIPLVKEAVDRVDIPEHPWVETYAIASAAFSREFMLPGRVPRRLAKGFREYTHFGSVAAVFDEAMKAQAYMPVNLTGNIIAAAEHKGITGFEVANASDVGNLLLRPDVASIVSTAALAANAFWATYSGSPDHGSKKGSYRTPYVFGNAEPFVFKDGQVSFSPEALKMLRNSLRQANGKHFSRPVGDVYNHSSSGCPALQANPRFTDAKDDQRNLATMKRYFKKSANELIAPRSATALEKCTQYLAQTLIKFG